MNFSHHQIKVNRTTRVVGKKESRTIFLWEQGITQHNTQIALSETFRQDGRAYYVLNVCFVCLFSSAKNLEIL